MPEKILLIHQNFPGQFRSLAADLLRDKNFEVRAIGRDAAPGMPHLPQLKLYRYKPHREVTSQTHAYVRGMENAVLHGQAVLRLLLQLRTEKFVPDVILAHPGWGETLFVREVFPRAKLIHFCEYYYHTQGADANFDPEFPLSIDERARIRARNALHLLNLENCDLAVTPTRWQHSLHPAAYRDKIRIAHEGIEIDGLNPDPQAVFALPDGREIKCGDPILTYVARNLEPYRGFHSFMRALPFILKQHSTAEILLVGGDEVSYGASPKNAAGNWRELLLREVNLPEAQLKRVHFLGRIPYNRYRQLLQVSSAHVYLTYPFVLSWSTLEAMAMGCLLIGSRTKPVEEVVEDGVTGILVDFFDYKDIAAKAVDALKHPEKYMAIRAAAREFARKHYNVAEGLRVYRELISA